jgi:acyl transferase domain-containing protein/NADP-dependent 3-hydroxy acid dehydrogenase YdfG
MGTAYLFTDEIVGTGATVEVFQRNALECDQTVILESGPGHASRCAFTPFTEFFVQKRKELISEGVPVDEARKTLDGLILGRLRLAAKGSTRVGKDQEVTHCDEGHQQREGMYMLGQLATLRREKTNVASLHRNVTADAHAMLVARSGERIEADTIEPAPADIAIIGMSCVLPGANEVEEYWENILGKIDAITEIPPDRWDWRLYFDENREAEDRIYSKWGGFLDHLTFEPASYGMPPKSVASVDPMQLMALEVARRALADAGYEDREFDRERASVIIGASGGAGDVGMQYGLRAELPRFQGELPREIAQRLPQWTEDTFPGILINVVAGRIANRLNLGGANFTIDAACAASLAAVLQGVNSLVAGQSSLVIAGGVDTMQGPFGYLCFSKTQALSPRGRCRTFDRSADGIVISEGLGMLVLKRLADAERDGDRIYAVIKGIGASSDGKARGLTAPLPAGQLRAMRRAYAQAGFGPETIGLFEAHGTGTVAGDTAELESTTRLIQEAGGHPRQAAIGSVKTLVGHTKATAGAAGLMKAALALYHHVLPPHHGCEQPNDVLQAADCPLYLIDEARPWLSLPDRPRRASVSAFGFGGSNVHAVLEEYQSEYRPWLHTPQRRRWPAELLLWPAGDRRALRQRLQLLGEELPAKSQIELRDLAFNLAREWRPGTETLAIVTTDKEDLITKLAEARNYLENLGGELPPGVHFGGKPNPDAKVAVLFSGQGSQYPDMFRQVASHFRVVSDALSEADRLLQERFANRFGARKTLSWFVYPRGAYTEATRAAAGTALRSTDVAQPALGAIEAGLWGLMRQFGLRPDMLGGHSYGEFVALYASGMIDFAALMELSESRGRYIVDAAKNADSELGTMAAVQASRDTVEKLIAGIDGVLLANHNAPDQCIISGSDAGVRTAVEKISANGIEVSEIPVAAAFHSPFVAPAISALGGLIEKTSWRNGGIPVYSNSTGEPHSHDLVAIRRTMTEHLVRPVEFVAEVEAMYRDGARTFLEIGPKSVLTRLVDRILSDRPHESIAVDGGGGGIVGLLRAFAQLICAGVNLDVAELFAGRDCLTADPGNLKQLQRGTVPSPHAWLLNGSGARRVHEPVRQVGVLQEELRELPANSRSATPLGAGHLRDAVPAVPLVARLEAKEEPEMGNNKTAPTSNDGGVMSEYFETMRRFLETQERVMSWYVGTAPAPRRPALRPQPVIPARPVREIPAPKPIRSDTTVPSVVSPNGPEHQHATPIAAVPPAAERHQPAAAESTPSKSNGLDRAGLAKMLLSIVEQRTGYPPEMVGLQQNLEAELGIDSIKRVEIVGALLKGLPPAYAQALGQDRGKLNTQSTLDGMLDLLEGLKVGGAAAVPFDSAETATPATASGRAFRHVIEATVEEIDPVAQRRLEQGLILVTADSLGVARELVLQLEKRGSRVSLIESQSLGDVELLRQRCAALAAAEPRIAGIVHLAQLGADWLPADSPSEAWQSQLQLNEKSLFTILSACGNNFEDGASILSASGLGGHFGRDNRNCSGLSLQAGAVGLLKSLKQERPHLRVKAVDVDPGRPPSEIASTLLVELELVGGRQEVGYPGGRRTIFRTVATPEPETAPGLEVPRNLVMMATGGLRGITAELLRDLALPGNTLVVTGRTPLPGPEPEETRSLTGAGELRQYFINEIREGRMKLTPGKVESRVQSILTAREMHANLEDFRKRGATVQYFDVDVTDDATMTRLFADIEREFGALNGVIHGAGVIEDRLLQDKSSASWSRVVDTKVCGLLNLQKHVKPPALKFFTVLSSVAGRYGNSGQTDYATANELMNRLCCQIHSLWKGQVTVRALCWGPWGPTCFGSGMVTADTEAKFARKGVRLVAAERGRRLFAGELRSNGNGPVEVICGEGPWEEREAANGRMDVAARANVVTLGPLLAEAEVRALSTGEQVVAFTLNGNHKFLQDHRMDGTPVLPAAAALEIMAEAVRQLWLGWHVVEARECRVLNGIKGDAPSSRLNLHISPGRYDSIDGFDVDVAIQSETGNGRPRVHYQAVIRLGRELPEGFTRQAPAHEEKSLSASKAYGEWLSHGPTFQVIERIDGLSAGGACAVVRSTRPAEWVLDLPASSKGWVFDPAVVDAAAQMAWVWARAFNDETALPARFGRVVQYEHVLPERLIMDFERIASEEPHLIHANVYFLNSAGRVLLMIEGLESISSVELNRLGAKAREAKSKAV